MHRDADGEHSACYRLWGYRPSYLHAIIAQRPVYRQQDAREGVTPHG